MARDSDGDEYDAELVGAKLVSEASTGELLQAAFDRLDVVVFFGIQSADQIEFKRIMKGPETLVLGALVQLQRMADRASDAADDKRRGGCAEDED